ncbi:MAG: TolC family protein [Bacteroidota bacterium]
MKFNNTKLLRKVLFLSVILSCSMQMQAQRSYTLQECIDQAFKNNITIKQRELTQRSVEADRLQSKLNVLPSVNGQATNNYNIGFAINPVTNATEKDATFRSNNFAISSSVTLFNGFQNVNTIKQQNANAKATDADLLTTKNNIALQVSNAYMQVLMNAEITTAREIQIQSTAEQLKRQERLYELGGVNKVKLLQLKAQYASEESQLITAQTQLDQSYLTLWQLMNMAPDPNNTILKPDSSSVANIPNEIVGADVIYKSFLDKSPEVQAAKSRAEAARISHNVALGTRSPRLTLGASISSFYSTQTQQGVGTPSLLLVPIGQDAFGNPSPYFTSYPQYSSSEVVPFGEQFNRNLGKNVGFTLSVPIFNGYQASTNVQKARINRMSSELTQKQTELDLYKNVNQAYLDFKSSQKRYESNQNNYDANKEALTLAESQFNLGALSTADFIVTKSQYLQAETNLVQSKYELLFRRKVLDFYLGKGLY